MVTGQELEEWGGGMGSSGRTGRSEVELEVQKSDDTRKQFDRRNTERERRQPDAFNQKIVAPLYRLR